MTANAQKINELMPQHQCGRCGYAACQPYADAIACGEAKINRCSPGGALVIEALSQMLGCAALPLSQEVEAVKAAQVAVIDPQTCIGCTKCLAACPVDSIVGAPKRLHQVIEAACTGCKLCIDPCPVDCISLRQTETHQDLATRLDPRSASAWSGMAKRANELRDRYQRHYNRELEAKRRSTRALNSADHDDLAVRRQEVFEAVRRVKQRRSAAH